MKEVYTDTGLLTGTHHGTAASAFLYDPDREFDILDALGRMLKNTTTGLSGVVVAQTATTATATGVTWSLGDGYILYVTATPDSVISSTEVCRMSGFAYPKTELVGGIHPDHADDPQDKFEPRARRK